jgi:hypothetical protein
VVRAVSGVRRRAGNAGNAGNRAGNAGNIEARCLSAVRLKAIAQRQVA